MKFDLSILYTLFSAFFCFILSKTDNMCYMFWEA